MTVRIPADAEIIIENRRQRFFRDDAVRWVWVFYGIAQATVTMLMAFNVIEDTTVAAVVTAIALVVYVAVNEIIVRPYRWGTRTRDKQSIDEIPIDEVQTGEESNPP